MKVTRHQAVQVHPVPDKIQNPQGPFPKELFRESEIISDYEPSFAEDGGTLLQVVRRKITLIHPRYYAAGLALLGLWRMKPKVMCVNNG